MIYKEWANTLKKETNRNLIKHLRHFGCDPYYYDLWDILVKEIERRLLAGKDF